MTCGAPDIFDITRTHTALTSHNAVSGRLHLAGEKGLQGSHSGTDQKKGGIVVGNEGVTG